MSVILILSCTKNFGYNEILLEVTEINRKTVSTPNDYDYFRCINYRI